MPGMTEGTITVNRAPRGRFFSLIASYVAQEDSLMGCFTVRETLHFAAAMTLPYEMSPAEKEKRVRRVMEDVGLTTAADTRVGDMFFRGLSGGQKVILCLRLLPSLFLTLLALIASFSDDCHWL
jgi:ABC-type multidrug transport system ATPase subunit